MSVHPVPEGRRPPGERSRSALEQRLRRLAWNLLQAPARALDRHVRSRRLPERVRHVSGPEGLSYAADEVLAICIVRNGAFHLRSFLEHHFRLGVRHVVLLDNGSTDATLAIAAEYAPQVTLLQTELPYRRYENVMKRYLARRFSAGRWNLCVDVDERFDYPFSETLPLRDLLRYLNQRGFTAVVAQMLDLFGEEPFAEMRELPAGGVREAFPYYDLSAIRTTEYSWAAVPDPRIRMHWGGIRRTLFGTDVGLTKAALVRVEDADRLFIDWHHAPASRVADVTAVLLHYPFAGSFRTKTLEAVGTRRYGRFTGHYRRYLERLERDPGLRIQRESVRRLDAVDALVEEGFLVASQQFRDFVAIRTRPAERLG